MPRRVRRCSLAVLAVEQVAHGSSPGFIRLGQTLAFVGVDPPLRRGLGLLGRAASWAAIGESGFIRLELKLF